MKLNLTFNEIKFVLRKHHRWMIACYFTLLGLILRYKEFAARELWGDEISQFPKLLEPFRPFWERLPYYQDMTCFRGDYFITYPFAQIFGLSKWGLAMPHILVTILAFYLLYIVCNKNLKTLVGFTIPFIIFSFNRNLVFHAFELRPYSVLIMLGLAVFFFTQRIVYDIKELSVVKKFFIAVFMIATVGFHATGGLMLFACFLFFTFVRIKEESFKVVFNELWLFLSLLTLVALALFIWHATGNPDFNIEHCRVRKISPFDMIPNPVANFNDFLRNIFDNLIGYKKFKAKLLINGILLTLLIPNKDKLKQIGFFLSIIIIPLQLICIADMYTGYWFLPKQFVWMMPLYAYFLGWCWESFFLFIKNFIQKINIKI